MRSMRLLICLAGAAMLMAGQEPPASPPVSQPPATPPTASGPTEVEAAAPPAAGAKAQPVVTPGASPRPVRDAAPSAPTADALTCGASEAMAACIRRLAPRAECDDACLAPFRAVLAARRPTIRAEAAKAVPTDAAAARDWLTFLLAGRCVGGPDRQPAERGACRAIAANDAPPSPTGTQGKAAPPPSPATPPTQPGAGKWVISWPDLEREWGARLTLLFVVLNLIVSISVLVLLLRPGLLRKLRGRRIKKAPVVAFDHEEESSPTGETSSTPSEASSSLKEEGKEFQAGDTGAESDDQGERGSDSIDWERMAKSLALPDDAEDLERLKQSSRLMQSGLARRMEGVPAPVSQLFSVIRTLGQSLSYKMEPPEEFRTTAARALQKLDARYSLYWREPKIAADHEEWYEPIRSDAPISGALRITKVRCPGLKRNGLPIVPALIETDYGRGGSKA